jgi:hypothetical protein
MARSRGISLGVDREDPEATVGVNAAVRIIWLVVRATLARLKTPFEKLIGLRTFAGALTHEGSRISGQR